MKNGSEQSNYTVHWGPNHDQLMYSQNYTGSERNEWGMHQNGVLEEIRMVSDFLYYGLDAWGKANRNSTNPQCSDNDACAKIGRNACCASINMQNLW